MKSWGVLIFAGILSVGTANVELYSFFKETDSKHSAQTNTVQMPSASDSLLQVPLGFQLQLVPSHSKSLLGPSSAILLPQQGYLPGSNLRASNLLPARVSNHTTHKPMVRSEPDDTGNKPSGKPEEAPDPLATETPSVRSVVRLASDPVVAQALASNKSATQQPGREQVNSSPPAVRSQIQTYLPNSPQSPNDLQGTLNLQEHSLLLQTKSQLQCDFPEYRAMVCVGDLEATCDQGYRVDPKCPYKQERCICSEGYVRPFDYHDVHHISGTCNPQSSCLKKGGNVLQ